MNRKPGLERLTERLGIDRVRGVRLTVLGFLVALLAAPAMLWLAPTQHAPGLHTKPPREIPVTVVGQAPDVQTMRDALNGPSDHPVAAVASGSRDAAEHALMRRDTSAVLVMGEDGTHELLVTSAANAVEASEVRTVISEILAVSDQQVTVTDLVPQDSRDPDGIGSFRLAMAWAMLGVTFAGLLGVVFGARSTANRLVLVRQAGLAIGAVTAGMGGAVLSTVVLDRFDAPFWTLAAFGALLVLATGTMTLALQAWFGIGGLVVAAVVILGLGVPGAMGAWPLHTLSSVVPTTMAWLPPGAGTWGIRGLAHFDGAGVGRVVVMWCGWIVVGLGLSLVAATDHDPDPRLRRFHPVLRAAPIVSGFLGLVLVGVVIVLPAAPSFTRTDLSPALSVGCTPITTPDSVSDLNAQISAHRDFEGFVGGDVGASTSVADGRLLFVFGDTIRTPDVGSRQMVRNSMLVFGNGCGGVLHRRDHGAVIPDRADGVGYWPMSIASADVDGYHLVGVMAQRVRTTGTDLFDFENLGPALAIFRVDRGQPPVLQRVMDIGPDDASTARPAWGAAAHLEGDTVYLYGTSRPTGQGFGWALSVARVPLTSMARLDQWRYWNGTSWQSDPAQAAPLISQDGGVSQTLSVFRQDDTWYALSKRDDFLGTELVAWTSPGPHGPFRARPPLARIPSARGVLRYTPLAHPELLPEPGTMVVSVSRNTANTAAIWKNPSLYRLEFLRVRLP